MGKLGKNCRRGAERGKLKGKLGIDFGLCDKQLRHGRFRDANDERRKHREMGRSKLASDAVVAVRGVEAVAGFALRRGESGYAFRVQSESVVVRKFGSDAEKTQDAAQQRCRYFPAFFFHGSLQVKVGQTLYNSGTHSKNVPSSGNIPRERT